MYTLFFKSFYKYEIVIYFLFATFVVAYLVFSPVQEPGEYPYYVLLFVYIYFILHVYAYFSIFFVNARIIHFTKSLEAFVYSNKQYKVELFKLNFFYMYYVFIGFVVGICMSIYQGFDVFYVLLSVMVMLMYASLTYNKWGKHKNTIFAEVYRMFTYFLGFMIVIGFEGFSLFEMLSTSQLNILWIGLFVFYSLVYIGFRIQIIRRIA